jgi:hypothetical protein
MLRGDLSRLGIVPKPLDHVLDQVLFIGASMTGAQLGHDLMDAGRGRAILNDNIADNVQHLSLL